MAARRRTELVEAVRGIPVFADLTKHHLREVAKVCSEIHYEAGDVLVRELDWGQHLVAILAGKGRVVRNNRQIAEVGPGDVVGEMSLLDGQPRSATVIADTAVEALVLYGTAFRKLLDDNPTMCRRLLLAQTARLREADRKAAARG